MGERRAVTPDAVREEQRRLRYLRALVDLAANVIMQGRLPRQETSVDISSMIIAAD